MTTATPARTTKSFALRLPETMLDELRDEAEKAHRSLNGHIVWLLSRRHLLPAQDPYEALRALRGTMPDLVDVRAESREADRRRQEFLDRLRNGE